MHLLSKTVVNDLKYICQFKCFLRLHACSTFINKTSVQSDNVTVHTLIFFAKGAFTYDVRCFCVFLTYLPTLIRYFTTYSSVPNRRACRFINFEEKIHPARLYFGLHVYFFLRKKSPLQSLIWVCMFNAF